MALRLWELASKLANLIRYWNKFDMYVNDIYIYTNMRCVYIYIEIIRNIYDLLYIFVLILFVSI